MTTSMLIHDCVLIDCTGSDPVPHAWVRVEGDRIAQIGRGAPPKLRDGAVIDAAGRTLMPGMIDAHAHLGVVTQTDPRLVPPARYALTVAREIEETLADGFTTVRDAGGLDWGFKDAIDHKLIRGPRLFVSNGALTQTGGHADQRPRTQSGPVEQVPGIWWLGPVVDGPDQVRWAAREMLRRGADQIKVMANGGCMSPTDKLSSTQFTVSELRAAVEEATAQGTYVLAHTYTPSSIINCIQAGVRTLEHGNFLNAEAAEAMARSGTYLVPTITTYELLAAEGRQLRYPKDMIRKIQEALRGAYESLRIAREAGVRIGSGSDVLSFHQRKKGCEPAYKAKVLSAMGAIVATTRINAEILGLQQELGTIEESKLADLLLVDGNPLDDPSILADRARIQVVIQNGAIVADRRPP